MTTAELPISRPSLALLGTEPWRAALEFFSHTLQHKLARPRDAGLGDGHPVIIFPGLGTDGSAVGPLREHCRSLGYAAFDWGRGYNTGPTGSIDDWLADLASHVSRLIDRQSGPATLLGWSLGGLYARELGKLLAPNVRQVITIGTPFNSDEDHTNVGWMFRMMNGAPASLDPVLSRRLRTPPPVPTTSIYSRSDGVVAWQTCIHAKTGGRVQDIEVRGSHIGMGWNPDVFRIVADRLQQAPGRWKRYATPA